MRAQSRSRQRERTHLVRRARGPARRKAQPDLVVIVLAALLAYRLLLAAPRHLARSPDPASPRSQAPRAPRAALRPAAVARRLVRGRAGPRARRLAARAACAARVRARAGGLAPRLAAVEAPCGTCGAGTAV